MRPLPASCANATLQTPKKARSSGGGNYVAPALQAELATRRSSSELARGHAPTRRTVVQKLGGESKGARNGFNALQFGPPIEPIAGIRESTALSRHRNPVAAAQFRDATAR